LYLGSGAFNNRNETPETPIQKSQYIAGCLSSDFIIIPLSSNSADSKTRIKAIKLDFVAFAQYQIHDIELILSSGTRSKAFTAASMDSFEKREASCSPRPQGVSTHIGTGNQKQPEALYPEEAIIPKTTNPKRKENNKGLILLLLRKKYKTKLTTTTGTIKNLNPTAKVARRNGNSIPITALLFFFLASKSSTISQETNIVTK
tara:strand:+ start:82 stop:690 length:609 start_codon:yes stop_codon:yes gene_type:complete